MNGTELKQCPFCGQYMMCDEHEDVRDYCTCDGAKKYQTRMTAYANWSIRLKKLCGEGCDEDEDTSKEIRAVFKPISEEAYQILSDALYAVVFQQIGKVSVNLADGTTVTITPQSLERKVSVKNKMI